MHIPYSWRAEINAQLDELLAKDIIAEMDYTKAWCHPIVPHLEEAFRCQVVRGPYMAQQVCSEAYLSCAVPTRCCSCYRTRLLMVHHHGCNNGIFQVRIAEEDQDLTRFITPWGSFTFKHAPMGRRI